MPVSVPPNEMVSRRPSPPSAPSPVGPCLASRSGSGSTSGSVPGSYPVSVSAAPSGPNKANEDPSGWKCFKLPHSLLSPAAKSLFGPNDVIYFRCRELPDSRQDGQPKQSQPRQEPVPKTHPGHARSLDCITCILESIIYPTILAIGTCLLVIHYLINLYTALFTLEYVVDVHLPCPRTVKIYHCILGLFQLITGYSLPRSLHKLCIMIDRETTQWRIDNRLPLTLRWKSSDRAESGKQLETPASGKSPIDGNEETKMKHSHLREYITKERYQANPPSDSLYDWYDRLKVVAGCFHQILKNQAENYLRNRLRYEPIHLRCLDTPCRLLDKGFIIVRLYRHRNFKAMPVGSVSARATRGEMRTIDCATEEYVRLLREGKLKSGSDSEEGVQIQEVDLRYEECYWGATLVKDTYLVRIKSVASELKGCSDGSQRSVDNVVTECDEVLDSHSAEDTEGGLDSDSVVREAVSNDDSKHKSEDESNDEQEPDDNHDGLYADGESGKESDEAAVNDGCETHHSAPEYPRQQDPDQKYAAVDEASEHQVTEEDDEDEHWVDASTETQAIQPTEADESETTDEEWLENTESSSTDSDSFEADDEEYYLTENSQLLVQLNIGAQAQAQAQNQIQNRWRWFNL